MCVLSSHIHESVASNPDYNGGLYSRKATVLLTGSIYGTEVRVVNTWGREMLGAWGYATSEAEAQQLGETLEDLLRMRHELMERSKENTQG